MTARDDGKSYIYANFQSEIRFVQIKLQFQAVLDQVFPEFKCVYGAIFCCIRPTFDGKQYCFPGRMPHEKEMNEAIGNSDTRVAIAHDVPEPEAPIICILFFIKYLLIWIIG
jgi:hypothetical protein